MTRVLLGLLMLATAFATDSESEPDRAWQRLDWVTWSQKTGLPVATIERLWHAVGGDGESIEHIDSMTLPFGRQILFVTSHRDGHCIKPYVFGTGDKLLWKPGDICNEYGPDAYITPRGDITVQLPAALAWVHTPGNDHPVSTALTVRTYRWNGATYELAKTETIPTYQSETFNPEKCPQERPCPERPFRGFACSEDARAWHHWRWATWSLKSGLPESTIERFFNVTIGPDAADCYGDTESVDALTLRSRGQILFVTASGSGHCLSLYVFGAGEKILWKSGPFCREQLLNYPQAYVKPTGDIAVQVPAGAAWYGDQVVSTELLVYTYHWNGSAYVETESKIVTYHSETFNAEKCPLEGLCSCLSQGLCSSSPQQ